MERTECLERLLKSTNGSYMQIILKYDFYITDRTETTSICQLNYADAEKVIPKLIKALHRKILPF